MIQNLHGNESERPVRYLRSRWSLTAKVTATPPHGDAMRLIVTANCSEAGASDLGLSLN
jgi:hypothetical protein